jgi:hypothetical protein
MLLGEKACGLFELRIGAHEQEEFLDQLSDFSLILLHIILCSVGWIV